MSLAWQRRLLTAILVLAALVALWPVLGGDFIWDDAHYVTGNPTLTAEGGLGRIWFEPESTPQYYPLVHTLYWLEHKAWGFHPLGYHAVNLFLHILAALLLWRALSLLQIPGAWLAALLFAIHPVQVETVAWIAERKNVLSAVFYLGSALCLLKYYFPASRESGASRWYVAGFILFLCALLSKTVTVTLPVALLIVLWWRNGRITKHEAASLIPFFTVALVFGLHTAWLEVHHVGALGQEWTLSLAQKVILAGKAPWFYAYKLLVPSHLVFNYPRWNLDPARWSLYLYPVAWCVLLFLLWQYRNKFSRGPLAAVLFFLVTLFPALGFFRVYPFRYSYVADHFQYMACIGLFVLASAIFATLLKNRKAPALVLAVLLAGGLGYLTWNQAHVFKDSQTLWAHTLQGNPRSFQAHNDLGTILAGQGNLDEAINHFQQALAIRPDFVEALNNLSMARLKQGDSSRAEQTALKALSLDPQNATAHMSAGMACLAANNRNCAIKHLALAVASRPDWGQANFALAKLLVTDNRPAQARPFFETALSAMPDYIPAYLAYARVLERARAYVYALRLYDHAQSLAPYNQEVLSGKAMALFHAGYKTEALSLMKQVLDASPKTPANNYNYGLMLLAEGRADKARAFFETALSLDPNFSAARKALEIAAQ